MENLLILVGERKQISSLLAAYVIAVNRAWSKRTGEDEICI